MSASKPTPDKLVNPASRFLEYKGSDGELEFYEKTTKKKYRITLPFTGVICDQLITATGYDEKNKNGYWSNEVRDLDGVLKVVSKEGVYCEGKWSDIKYTCAMKKIQFTISLYVATKNEQGEDVLWHIKLSGSGLGNFFEARKPFSDLGLKKIKISKGEKQKNGAVFFYRAFFEITDTASSAEKQACISLDKILQEYLDAYFKKPDAVNQDPNDYVGTSHEFDEHYQAPEEPEYVKEAPPIRTYQIDWEDSELNF